MAAKTLYLTTSEVDNWCSLSESAQTAATTASGWTVSTGATNHSELESGVERAASTFTGTTVPDGSLDSTLGDAFRAGPFTGNFANANWTFQFAVRAVTNGGAQDGRIRFRLFKGPNADGSSATEITAAQQQASEVLNVATGADSNSTLTFNPGAFSVENDYLFVQVAWERTGAGGMTNADVLLRTGSSGPAGTHIVTADFSATTVVSAPVLTHSYTPQSPKANAMVRPSAVAHTYSPLTPKTNSGFTAPAVSHTYVGGVPQVSTSVLTLPMQLNNYLFVKGGDGLGFSERRR